MEVPIEKLGLISSISLKRKLAIIDVTEGLFVANQAIDDLMEQPPSLLIVKAEQRLHVAIHSVTRCVHRTKIEVAAIRAFRDVHLCMQVGIGRCDGASLFATVIKALYVHISEPCLRRAKPERFCQCRLKRFQGFLSTDQDEIS